MEMDQAKKKMRLNKLVLESLSLGKMPEVSSKNLSKSSKFRNLTLRSDGASCVCVVKISVLCGNYGNLSSFFFFLLFFSMLREIYKFKFFTKYWVNFHCPHCCGRKKVVVVGRWSSVVKWACVNVKSDFKVVFFLKNTFFNWYFWCHLNQSPHIKKEVAVMKFKRQVGSKT